MNTKPKRCLALPEEVEEAFKRGLSFRFEMDSIDKLNRKTPVLSPAIDPQTHKCTFDTGHTCELIQKGLSAYGCPYQKKSSVVNVRKRWLSLRAMAIKKFFVHLLLTVR